MTPGNPRDFGTIEDLEVDPIFAECDYTAEPRKGFDKYHLPDTRCRSIRDPAHTLQCIKQVSMCFKEIALGQVSHDNMTTVLASPKFGSLAENTVGAVPVQKLHAIKLGDLEGLLFRHFNNDNIALSKIPSMAIDRIRATGFGEAHMCDPV
ncbi:hypothetical protein M527_21080 [Sphingobium indicum IP26]|uniref:Uncharacterized protein n=1 Tax=Sphingobium indicum F2 TaxID=1450518 RepID=A0A8E1C1D2_9SPHN|nr:hypothetical protein M527_21080 [Sphingobium indicum IP26]KER35077.1 hypothetical protein AL00_18075 [Sphingobium indicum F2]